MWAMWMSVALMVLFYLPVYVDTDPALATKGLFGASLLVGGTLMSLILCGFKSDDFFSFEEILGSVGYIVMGVAAIYVVNYAAPLVTASAVDSPISGTIFVMLMAISEEAMFRGFLLGMINKLTGSSLIAVALSSLVGAIYHLAVYGSSFTNLAIVFGSFFALGFSYVLSGYRLSVPMTAHVIINFLSSL
jgi:membrane protease YdiL (CAAX protease family)